MQTDLKRRGFLFLWYAEITFFYIHRPTWRKVVALILWPVPEAAVTVLCTPDDGCDGHPKHVG